MSSAESTEISMAELAFLFREFAGTSKKLPLYQRLCLGAADDPDVVARLYLARPEQRRPNLLLAAVHDVLLAGEDHPLAAWYASVSADPRPLGQGPDDPWPHFRDLALSNERVAELVRANSTQTNEVGRCAALLLAVAGISSDTGRPVGLVDVGSSAGLNLLLDRYHYRYLPGGSAGDPSGVDLVTKVWGDRPVPVPDHMPVIASRIGLDLHPVDVTDPVSARWLVACQWPDQMERLERTRAALQVANQDPPVVVQGDAVDDLVRAVETVPVDAIPVVTTSWVMAYLPTERQRAFIDQLDRIAEERDISLVYAEAPIEVPGLPMPGGDGVRDDATSALVRVDWRAGARTATRLARVHPHVRWIEWLV